MMSLTEVVDAFCNLTPERQTALIEFMRASTNGHGVTSALDSISNEEVRNEFIATLRSSGTIA